MQTQKVIPFMKFRHIALAISLTLIVISIASLAIRGLNFGLDFTGGALLELHFDQPADLPEIRQGMSDLGYPNSSVVNFGSDRDVQIRFQTDNSEVGQKVGESFISKHPGSSIQRISYVGPQVGDELTNNGGLGLLFSLIAVSFYVALRFQYKFSIGAVSALVHDVIITLGVFSLFQLTFDLTALAAVLAVIGYSINDTIVVYDRVRENFRVVRRSTVTEIVDVSMTQTLERSIMTSVTVLLVLFALLFVGGEALRYFSLALITGVFVGTYSSVYIATSLLLSMGIAREDLLPAAREGEGFDSHP